ncbi:MAG: ribosomal L7Ae/L30e/S12e/Gadd45 family protein [Thermoproteota archaeon]|nr:ribosomal L7Ae/L30e/S12e/Gadd45 family protein [Candidatus Brockarchaeota archaeon]
MAERASLSSRLELLAKTGSFVAGFNEVYRLLLQGKLEGVIYVSNLPQPMLSKLRNAIELSKTPAIVYEGSRVVLGKALNLKHPTSVIGILNQGESGILEETKQNDKQG